MNLMFDASTPPESAPIGYKAVAGYIGGDTPHVWSRAEWKRFSNLRKLPIFVRSNLGANGQDDAVMALQRLYQIGCPPGSRVAWDMETSVQVDYLLDVFKVMRFFGYYVWVYGSASTVFSNPVCNGYWVADFKDGSPFMYPIRSARATQYKPGQVFDSSTIRAWQLRHLWK